MIGERRADPLVQFRDDALSLLIRATHEDGSPLDDRVIRDELLTMIMAGYETTTAGLTWAFERLLRSPDKLERLVDELDTGDQDVPDGGRQGDPQASSRGPDRCAEGLGPDRADGLQPPGGLGADGLDLPHPRRSRALSGARGDSSPSVFWTPIRRAPTGEPGSPSAAGSGAASAPRLAQLRDGGRDPHGARGGDPQPRPGSRRAGRPQALHLSPGREGRVASKLCRRGSAHPPLATASGLAEAEGVACGKRLASG